MKNIKMSNIRPMRTQGGTLYTFNSALEDIGLNINESKNTVKLTNYALLDIPECSNSGDFNILPKNSNEVFDAESTTELLAESFLKYALNLENNLINDNNYDFTTSLNVSERVFWKWLINYGAVKFEYNFNTNRFDDVYPNNSIIKAIGAIDAVSQRSGNTGLYNEIYVNIPSSFGSASKIIFNAFNDKNYQFNKTINCSTNINMISYPTNKNGHGFFDNYVNIEDNDADNIGSYELIPSPCISFNIDDYDYTSFDELHTNTTSLDYNFNTILLYYTIYDKNNKALATNLYGVYFIDAPNDTNIANDENHTYKFKLPSLTKRRSTLSGFGTSYSFKINLRTRSIYDSTESTINDESSSELSVVNQFSDVIANLTQCVNSMMTTVKNTNTLNRKYDTVVNTLKIINENVTKLQQDIINISGTNERDVVYNTVTTNQITTDNIVSENSNLLINADNIKLDSDILNITNSIKTDNYLTENKVFENANMVTLTDNDAAKFKNIKIVNVGNKYRMAFDPNIVDIDTNAFYDVSTNEIDILSVLSYLVNNAQSKI